MTRNRTCSFALVIAVPNFRRFLRHVIVLRKHIGEAVGVLVQCRWSSCPARVIPWFCRASHDDYAIAVMGRVRFGFKIGGWLVQPGRFTKAFFSSFTSITSAGAGVVPSAAAIRLAIPGFARRSGTLCWVSMAWRWYRLWCGAFSNRVQYVEVHLFLHFDGDSSVG